jgi:lambda family phage minor tail protein L
MTFETFTAETQKFAPSNLITLFQLDCTAIGGPVLLFTGSQDSAGPIIFNGQTYSPVPIEASGFEISSTGSLPTPTIKILNIPEIQAGVIAMKDLVGATLYRIRTFATFLDDGATPDPNAHYPIDIWTVDRKSNQNKVYIEWELAATTDQQGRKIPGRQVLQNFCNHIYRSYNALSGTFDYSKATCPYTGTTYLDINDNSCAASADVCGKKLTSCKGRFGSTAELPTRAFPGVSPIQQ